MSNKFKEGDRVKYVRYGETIDTGIVGNSYLYFGGWWEVECLN